MSGLVVDASIASAWLFDDENHPRADVTLEHLKEGGAVVPQLWHWEIRISAEHRKRISMREINERLDAFQDLPIQTDEEPDLRVAFGLAKKHGLSFYDALYLELAKRQHTVPGTLDIALSHAPSAEGVLIL